MQAENHFFIFKFFLVQCLVIETYSTNSQGKNRQGYWMKNVRAT